MSEIVDKTEKPDNPNTPENPDKPNKPDNPDKPENPVTAIISYKPLLITCKILVTLKCQNRKQSTTNVDNENIDRNMRK